MAQIMAIVNLTPDSFHAPSRVAAEQAGARIRTLCAQGADIIDLGAVSTRPGAEEVPLEEEWRRLAPVLRAWDAPALLSVDTTRAEIVRRVYDCAGPFLVNDISAGEDDPEMLATVARLGLPFVAMHKRGSPRSMDSLTDYPEGIVPALAAYFEAFGRKAQQAGIADWVLDPGPGLRQDGGAELGDPGEAGRNCRPSGGPSSSAPPTSASPAATRSGPTAWRWRGGAAILRVHDVAAARRSVRTPCQGRSGLFSDIHVIARLGKAEGFPGILFQGVAVRGHHLDPAVQFRVLASSCSIWRLLPAEGETRLDPAYHAVLLHEEEHRENYRSHDRVAQEGTLFLVVPVLVSVPYVFAYFPILFTKIVKFAENQITI